MKTWVLKKVYFTMAAVVTLAGAGIVGNQKAFAHDQFTTATTNENNGSDSNEVTDTIFQGLWAGVNLDFNQGIDSDFDDTTTTTSGVTHTEPNTTQSVTRTQPNPSYTQTIPSHTKTTPTYTLPSQPASPSPAPTTAGTYAALGDSVAAGVGLPTPLAVPSSQARCGRTAESYPVLVSRALNMPLVDVACSGATAGDIVTTERSGSPSQPAQLDTAFANGRPSLITITAGANDVNWQQFLSTCYYSNCATATSSATAAVLRTALHVKLIGVFTDIWSRSNGQPPTVVYTGYYNPVSAACQGRLQNITPSEIAWFASQVNALNATIQDVARSYSFVRFAPVNFTGHDICSAEPWVQGLSDPRPIHPTAAGQQVIAQDVLLSLGR